jgi:hypothetical protein
VEIVAATRLSAAEFESTAPLAATLRRVQRDPRIRPRITCDNVVGLPAIYNARIDSSDDTDVLVFTHDDVWIEDFYFVDRILEGLGRFDIIGLAGNTRRVPNQVRWATIESGKLDLPHLRGAIATDDHPMGKVGFFGPIIGECQLLDGVLLAARKQTLRVAGVRFDPAFDFHLYDLDFSRSAVDRGLKLGTWPVSVTHRSPGAFGDDSWTAGTARYLAKWGS